MPLYAGYVKYITANIYADIYLTEQKTRLIPSERDRPDVQVSEEMISAGAKELRGLDELDSIRDAAKRVYLAMCHVRDGSSSAL